MNKLLRVNANVNLCVSISSCPFLTHVTDVLSELLEGGIEAFGIGVEFWGIQHKGHTVDLFSEVRVLHVANCLRPSHWAIWAELWHTWRDPFFLSLFLIAIHVAYSHAKFCCCSKKQSADSEMTIWKDNHILFGQWITRNSYLPMPDMIHHLGTMNHYTLVNNNQLRRVHVAMIVSQQTKRVILLTLCPSGTWPLMTDRMSCRVSPIISPSTRPIISHSTSLLGCSSLGTQMLKGWSWHRQDSERGMDT